MALADRYFAVSRQWVPMKTPDAKREPEKVNEYRRELRERRYYSVVWMKAIGRSIEQSSGLGCRDRPDTLSIFHRLFSRYHT